MLILTRRVGQSVKIGDDIEITVLQASGDQVRLGISAPPQVKVYRAEVLAQIVAENARAAASAGALEEVTQTSAAGSAAPPQVPPAPPDNRDT